MTFAASPAWSGTPIAKDMRLPVQARPILPAGAGDGPGQKRVAQGNRGIFGAGPVALPVPSQDNQPRGPLGGSMRQPFDYKNALATLMPAEDKRSGFQRAAGVIAPMLLALGGNASLANILLRQNLARNQGRADQTRNANQTILDWRRDDYEAQRDADLRAANPFTIGRSRLQYDPASGQTDTLYQGGQDFELYAQELGLQPGTPDYFQAVEDFVLRSSGPSAHGRDLQLDDYRTANDEKLEGVRHGNRVSMEGMRQRNRMGLESVRQGNRVQMRSIPQARASSPRSGNVTIQPGEPTATGANGETLVVRNGEWVAAE